MNHPHNHFYACSEKHFPGIVWASIICHTLTAITILLPPENVQAAETPARNVPTVTHSRKTYNIAAGPLETVLNHFGREAGILLTFSPDTTTGLQSTGLQGSYTLQEGLDRLLIGSNLFAVHDAKGKYSLHKRSKTSTAQENATMLTEMTVTGAAIDPGVTEGTGSYTTNQSSYGKGQNLKELPQTVTVMTYQHIQDQKLFTMDDVMAYTPGVTLERTTSSGGKGSFYSRGFQVTNILRDGATSVDLIGRSVSSAFSASTLDMAMFDSIEVLRGSNALYGGTASAPGGAINLVRKKPMKTPQLKLNALASAGRWSNYRGEVDVGGPVALDGRIRGRLVGVYQDGKYFYDYSDNNKKLFYGIVEADITNSTLLTVGGHIQRDNDGYSVNNGLPRYSNGDDLKLPRSTYLGTPADRYRRDDNNLFIRIDQKIGKDWGLNIEATRDKYDYYRRNTQWLDPIIDPVGPDEAFIHSGLTDITGTNKALDVTLKGSFNLFNRKHHLILGANYSKLNQLTKFTDLGRVIEISDIFAYKPSDYPNPYNGAIYGFNFGNNKSKQRGLYGSLAIKITDPLTLIVGGRLSWYEQDWLRNSYSPSGEPTFSHNIGYKDDKVFTPYVGLTYELWKDWSVYASSAETYTPQSQSLSGPLPGKPLDPATGRTYEIGTKGSIFGDQLNLSFALYRVDNNDVANYDLNYPGIYNAQDGIYCCYLNDGKQISQGVDIEIGGEMAKGWQIHAGYTFNENETKGGDGRFSTITPKHLFKLWSSYELRGILNGLKLGGGVIAQSSSYKKGSAVTFNEDTGRFDGPEIDYEFTVPSRALVNLFAEYRFNKRWSTSFNVSNVFDKIYYETVGSIFDGNWYGAPRNFMLSMRYSY